MEEAKILIDRDDYEYIPNEEFHRRMEDAGWECRWEFSEGQSPIHPDDSCRLEIYPIGVRISWLITRLTEIQSSLGNLPIRLQDDKWDSGGLMPSEIVVRTVKDPSEQPYTPDGFPSGTYVYIHFNY